MYKKLLALAILSAGLALAAACGGDDNSTATPAGSGPTVTRSPAPADLPPPDTGKPVTPPMEGPPRQPATARVNYRDLPEWTLPAPQDLPQVPGDAQGAEYRPPAEPKCPDDWQSLPRPVEGFQICYPGDWVIDGHGYVSAGNEDRWYSVGFYLRRDGVEAAHVSLYVLNPFAVPFTYTRDCPHPYQVTFAGQPAVLCPDGPSVPPEVRIITYQLRQGDLDYYVNVVPKLTFDTKSGHYLNEWDKDAEATAIQVAQTFQLVPLYSPTD
ncbi:MAG: hypothetical protein Q7T33_15195 [Dehalococcoidia bacterium]|nr:hypothetical protein [Dehalococcoidia bacterium]